MLHIIRVRVQDTNKAGEPLISPKSGKPYYKVGIQTNEHGEQWLNGLLNFRPNWEGTEQDLVVVDDPKWGKQFKLAPKKDVAPAGDLNRVEVKIDNLTTTLQDMKGVLGQILAHLPQGEDTLDGEQF